MQPQSSKEHLRIALASCPAEQAAARESGRIAEQVRREPTYREAGVIYVAPGPRLLQMRINALVDGKELIMPAPALKLGFFRYRPYTIPPPSLSFAVTFKGQAKYAERLSAEQLARLDIDLLLTEALAVDPAGRRLGEGSGFFDLACALLAYFKAFKGSPPIYAVSRQGIVPDPLPEDPWDVKVSGVLTPEGLRGLGESRAETAGIYWEALEKKRIRKIDPLWWAYQKQRGEGVW